MPTTEKLTATITSVGPHGVTAQRHWGESDPDGTRLVHIHESDSPGITRHAVGTVIELVAAHAGAAGFERLPTAIHNGLRERLASG